MNRQRLHFGTIARHKSHSLQPGLWPDYAWVPALGTQGAVLPDVSGRRNNGTITGANWLTNGQLTFDGSGDSVNFGNILPSRYAARTIFVRFYLSATASDQLLIGKWTTGSTDGEWLLFFDDLVGVNSNSPNKISYVIRSSASTSSWLWVHNATEIAANTWYTLAIVHNNGVGVSMYLNGQLNDSYAQNANTTFSDIATVDTRIGEDNNGTRDLGGGISCLYVYNRALSAAQIRELSADPLCWLRRKSLVPMIVPSGGEPPVFKPFWARHCNNLIGVA